MPLLPARNAAPHLETALCAAETAIASDVVVIGPDGEPRELLDGICAPPPHALWAELAAAEAAITTGGASAAGARCGSINCSPAWRYGAPYVLSRQASPQDINPAAAVLAIVSLRGCARRAVPTDHPAVRLALSIAQSQARNPGATENAEVVILLDDSSTATDGDGHDGGNEDCVDGCTAAVEEQPLPRLQLSLPAREASSTAARRGRAIRTALQQSVAASVVSSCAAAGVTSTFVRCRDEAALDACIARARVLLVEVDVFSHWRLDAVTRSVHRRAVASGETIASEGELRAGDGAAYPIPFVIAVDSFSAVPLRMSLLRCRSSRWSHGPRPPWVPGPRLGTRPASAGDSKGAGCGVEGPSVGAAGKGGGSGWTAPPVFVADVTCDGCCAPVADSHRASDELLAQEVAAAEQLSGVHVDAFASFYYMWRRVCKADMHHQHHHSHHPGAGGRDRVTDGSATQTRNSAARGAAAIDDDLDASRADSSVQLEDGSRVNSEDQDTAAAAALDFVRCIVACSSTCDEGFGDSLHETPLLLAAIAALRGNPPLFAAQPCASPPPPPVAHMLAGATQDAAWDAAHAELTGLVALSLTRLLQLLPAYAARVVEWTIDCAPRTTLRLLRELLTCGGGTANLLPRELLAAALLLPAVVRSVESAALGGTAVATRSD